MLFVYWQVCYELWKTWFSLISVCWTESTEPCPVNRVFLRMFSLERGDWDGLCIGGCKGDRGIEAGFFRNRRRAGT